MLNAPLYSYIDDTRILVIIILLISWLKNNKKIQDYPFHSILLTLFTSLANHEYTKLLRDRKANKIVKVQKNAIERTCSCRFKVNSGKSINLDFCGKYNPLLHYKHRMRRNLEKIHTVVRITSSLYSSMRQFSLSPSFSLFHNEFEPIEKQAGTFFVRHKIAVDPDNRSPEKFGVRKPRL